jgi:DNA-binding NtrC family response regulator
MTTPTHKTPSSTARVLVVDDDAQMRRALARTLQSAGFTVEAQEDAESALALMASLRFDVLLVDVLMPGMGGMRLLEETKRRYPGVEVVMLTGVADVGTAVEALRMGAYHFLEKSAGDEEVRRVIEMAAEHKRLVDHARSLQERLEEHESFDEIVGSSRAMEEVFRLARSVARTDTTVMILGENGTGKELVARAIQRASERARKPFQEVDCGAIPDTLVESELFGSMRGAFNEARDRAGRFEQADGGTILLDEIGNLPLASQASLLRVLQERKVRRLGAESDRKIDVRVIVATNENLKQNIASGKFRQDLYFRLAVFLIHVPPLRQRKEDIPALAYHFLKKHGKLIGREIKRISPEALRLLREQPFPGNVRELENAVERAVVMARGDSIVPSDLPYFEGAEPSGGGASPGEPPPPPIDYGEMPYAKAKEQCLARFEKTYVEALLGRTNNNMTKAAEAAGMDRANFRRLVKRVRNKDGAASGPASTPAEDDGDVE